MDQEVKNDVGIRDYELMVIVSQDGEEKKKEYQEKIQSILSKSGIQIKEEKELYTRKFYHPIKKTNEGVYYLYNLQANPSSIVKTQKEFNLNQNILRFQYMRLSQPK